MIVAPLPDPRSSAFLDAWTRRWGVVGAALVGLGVVLGSAPPRWPTVPYGVEFVWGISYAPGSGAGTFVVPLFALLVALGACIGTTGRTRAFLLLFGGLGYIVVPPAYDALRDAIRYPDAWSNLGDFLWSHNAFPVVAALAGVGISAGNRVRRLRPTSTAARVIELAGGAVLPVAVLLQMSWHWPFEGYRFVDLAEFFHGGRVVPIVYVHEGLIVVLSLLGIAGGLRERRVTRRARLLGIAVVATPVLWFLFLDVAWGASMFGCCGIAGATISDAILRGCGEIGGAMRIGALYTGGWMICSVGLVALIETRASKARSASALQPGDQTFD